MATVDDEYLELWQNVCHPEVVVDRHNEQQQHLQQNNRINETVLHFRVIDECGACCATVKKPLSSKFVEVLETALTVAEPCPRGVSLLWPRWHTFSSNMWCRMTFDAAILDGIDTNEVIDQATWDDALKEWFSTTESRQRSMILAVMNANLAAIESGGREERISALASLWSLVHQESHLSLISDELLDKIVAMQSCEAGAIRVLWKLIEFETMRQRLRSANAHLQLIKALEQHHSLLLTGCLVAFVMLDQVAFEAAVRSGLAMLLVEVAKGAPLSETRRLALVGCWSTLRRSRRAILHFTRSGGIGKLAHVTFRLWHDDNVCILATACLELLFETPSVVTAPGVGEGFAICIDLAIRFVHRNRPNFVDALVRAALSIVRMRVLDSKWPDVCGRVDIHALIAALSVKVLSQKEACFSGVLERVLYLASLVAGECKGASNVGLMLHLLKQPLQSREVRIACGAMIVIECETAGGDVLHLLRQSNFAALLAVFVDDSLPPEARASLAPALSQLAARKYLENDARWTPAHVGELEILLQVLVTHPELRAESRGSFHGDLAIVLWHALLAMVRIVSTESEYLAHISDKTLVALAEVLRAGANYSARDILHVGVAKMAAILLWRILSRTPDRTARFVASGCIDDAATETLLRHGRNTDDQFLQPRLLIIDILWRALQYSAEIVCSALPRCLALQLERIVVATSEKTSDDESVLDAALSTSAAWLLFRLVIESPSHLAALRHRRSSEMTMIDVLVLGLHKTRASCVGRAALFALERVSTRSKAARLAIANKATTRLADLVVSYGDQNLAQLALRVVLNASSAVDANPAFAERLLDHLLDLANDSGAGPRRALAMSILSNMVRHHECRSMLYLRFLERASRKVHDQHRPEADEPCEDDLQHHQYWLRLMLQSSSRPSRGECYETPLSPPWAAQGWRLSSNNAPHPRLDKEEQKQRLLAFRKPLSSLWQDTPQPPKAGPRRQPVRSSSEPRPTTRGLVPFGPRVASPPRQTRAPTPLKSKEPWTPKFEACVVGSDGCFRAVVARGGLGRETFKIAPRGVVAYNDSFSGGAHNRETYFCLFKRVKGSKVGELLPTFVYKERRRRLSPRSEVKVAEDGDEYHCYYTSRVAEILDSDLSCWPTHTLPAAATKFCEDELVLPPRRDSEKSVTMRTKSLPFPRPPVPATAWRLVTSLADLTPVINVQRTALPPALHQQVLSRDGVWMLSNSVWSSRAKECDSRDFYESSKMSRSMLTRDWNELEQRPKFSNALLPKLGGGGVKTGLSRKQVKSAIISTLSPYYVQFLRALDYFVASHNDADRLTADIFSIACKETGLCENHDVARKFFKQAQQAAATVPASTNAEEDVEDEEKDETSRYKVDRAATLEALVRVVDCKYSLRAQVAKAANETQSVEHAHQLCDSVLRTHLVRMKDCLDKLPAAAAEDVERWRKRRMYLDVVDASIRPYTKLLRSLWIAFSQRSTSENASRRSAFFGVAEWLRFLELTGMMGSEVDRKDAKLAFFRSKMLVVDSCYLLKTHSFASFLEAICRVIDTVRLPARSCFAAVNASGLADFYEKLAAVSERRDEDDDDRALDLARTSESGDEPLSSKLDMVLPYMIQCLAVSCNGNFSSTDSDSTVSLLEYLTDDQRRRWFHQPEFPRIKRSLVCHRPGLIHQIAKAP